MKNYYEILGIQENSSQDEIKKSYRKLSKEYHPDINPNGGDKFKEINEANEILSDPQKRQQYDFQRKNPHMAGGRPGGGMGGFEDLFSQMFGGGNPFGGNPFEQRRPTAPSKMMKLTITPVESFLGVEKIINYNREEGCSSCHGSGGDQQKCGQCGGSGAILKTVGTGFMIQQIRMSCDKCGGKGFILIHRCKLCGGKGTKTFQKEVKLKIPVGSDNGQFLKLQGYGDYVNGINGDLVIQIEVESKDGYEKIDNDLIYSLFLNYDDLKKETYNIPHPHGDLNMKAPKIFDSSIPLRLKGKGYNGGDMYVKLFVKFDRN
jgi:molecular chaperone DnaJ